MRDFRFLFRIDPLLRNQTAKTPVQLLDALKQRFGEFDFDPCPPDPQFDGLKVEWGSNTYVNPPFNDLKNWLNKAVTEWKKGNKQIIFLMPVRVHTRYFLDIIFPFIESGEIDTYIIAGGVKFQDYTQKAPFGVMYLHFKNKS